MTEDSIEDVRDRRKDELLDEQSETNDTPDEPIEVEGRDHFQAVLNDHDTVLVDFYATWCGPCTMMAPAVEQLASDDGVTVAKVDVDQQKQLAQAWGVQGMPTIVVTEDGEETERAVGARNLDGLRSLVA